MLAKGYLKALFLSIFSHLYSFYFDLKIGLLRGNDRLVFAAFRFEFLSSPLNSDDWDERVILLPGKIGKKLAKIVSFQKGGIPR